MVVSNTTTTHTHKNRQKWLLHQLTEKSWHGRQSDDDENSHQMTDRHQKRMFDLTISVFLQVFMHVFVGMEEPYVKKRFQEVVKIL